jgi:hypothetical protein
MVYVGVLRDTPALTHYASYTTLPPTYSHSQVLFGARIGEEHEDVCV